MIRFKFCFVCYYSLTLDLIVFLVHEFLNIFFIIWISLSNLLAFSGSFRKPPVVPWLKTTSLLWSKQVTFVHVSSVISMGIFYSDQGIVLVFSILYLMYCNLKIYCISATVLSDQFWLTASPASLQKDSSTAQMRHDARDTPSGSNQGKGLLLYCKVLQ